ncbi:NTP transferase domain-containing protein [Heliobacillus mobilis]|uniref:NTP transferase domain-containing protein n=1 Tax=Heliobacterium mobile TaxID=28064 RepID=A0A6I3SI58_HELMO|nr:nucleotidyltransferase family protein [Heliobacterium mobile]MTV48452.1 NTP transferase domain-containing protein [Heliobacterium mobile]
MDALILAAGRNDGPLKACHGPSMEALIPLCGRPMTDYVVQALVDSQEIEQVVVVGPTELAARYAGDQRITVVSGGDDHLDSLWRGLRALPSTDGYLLIATGDLPLLNRQVVADFLGRCRENEGDVYYPVVRREICEERFPGVRRTFVRLQEGEFTGGNLFLVHRRVIAGAMERARQFIRLRKRPLALSRLLGWPFVIRFLLRRLSIEQAQQRMSAMFGFRAVCIVSPCPELAIDVDKPVDLEMIGRWLSKT